MLLLYPFNSNLTIEKIAYIYGNYKCSTALDMLIGSKMFNDSLKLINGKFAHDIALKATVSVLCEFDSINLSNHHGCLYYVVYLLWIVKKIMCFVKMLLVNTNCIYQYYPTSYKQSYYLDIVAFS